MESTNTQPLSEFDGKIIDYNFCTSYIFENYEEFCKNTSESSRGICSKALAENEFSFKCYDCELVNENQIYCADCFLNGNHENHRCFTLFAGGGCCDCGDSNILKPTGHCKNHNGFGDIEKELLNSLKIEEQKKFEKIISYIFMKGFKLCEKMVIISEKIEKLVLEGQIIENFEFEEIVFDFEDENNFDNVVKEVDINMLAFIKINLSVKMNSHFFNVLNILNQFIENNRLNMYISYQFTKNDLIKEFEFLHDCSDFQSKKNENLLHSCQCSINQLLFRFNILMTGDIQNSFFQLFLRFFVSNNYKLTLISDLGSYIRYLIKIKNNNNEIEINYSYFLEIWHQVFQGEQGDALCSDNYREGILYFIKILYNLWDNNNDLIQEFIRYISRFIDIGITKNLYSNNEKNQDFFIKILHSLSKFDLQETKQYSLYLSIQIYSIIGRIFYFANDLKKGEKKQFAFNLFNLIIPEIKTLQENYPKIRKPFIAPILSYLISFVNIESINFLDLGILNDELENLAKILFVIFFSEFSFKNFKKKFLDLNIFINQIISSISHEELEFYKMSEISIPDHEINIIQFCYQYLSFENCLQNLFKFYSLDIIFNNIIDLSQDNTNTNDIKLINIFLESFIITLIDTVHKVNTNRFIKPKTEYIFNLIEENMSQLFVMKHFYSSYQFFNYAEHIFNSETGYRDCIGKNIIIDKAKNIKLKNNDDIYFQPFSWIRFPQIYSRLIEVLKDKKNSELDLILSNKITFSKLKKKFANEFKFFNYLILGLIKIDEKKLKIELFINILKLIEIGVEGNWDLEENNNNINIILLTEFYNSDILKSYLKNMKETEEKDTFLKIEKKIRELKKKILSSKSRSGDQIGEIGLIEDEKKRKWKEKQREILAQFANKQTDFTTKFSEKIQIEDPKLENLFNKIICIDCHDSEIKENDYFVYPCLITRDNLEEYFYGVNQCDQKDIKKKQVNNGGFWISSCLHLIHHSCFIKQIKENSNQCSFCKIPINFFTPFYEEINKEFIITQKNDIINYKELSNLIEELSFNKYELPKEEKNIYFKFDNCIDHLIIINKNNIYESDKENLVELFRKCIISMIEYNFITTLDCFIKNIPILKNFIQLLKFTFQKFCDEQFYMKLKEDLIKNCYEIFFSFIQNKENNLDRFFIDISISIFLLNNDQDKNQDMLLGFSKMFIYHLALIYSNNDQKNKNLQNIDCIIYFFDSLKSKDFESKLFCFLNPYYKLIAIIFVILYDIYDFNLEKKIDWLNEEEDINLFKVILNNKKLSANYFFDFSNISKIYDCHGVLSKLNIPEFLLKNPFNKFNIIPIGDTYLEMRNKFFLKKCSKCNYYSENSLVFILCLICGKRMCHQFCTSEKYRNKIKEKKKKTWNIVQHNKTKHCSKGVFLDINSGQLFISDKKNIALIDCLYKDQFGENIKNFEDNKVDNKWSSYKLDEEQYRKIIDCLIMRKIEQKTHYVFIKNYN